MIANNEVANKTIVNIINFNIQIEKLNFELDQAKNENINKNFKKSQTTRTQRKIDAKKEG